MDTIYLQSFYVYSNYVDKNLQIDLYPEDNKSFKHLILTGKNGSGKSTTLKALFRELFNMKSFKGNNNSFYYDLLEEKKSKEAVDRNINDLGYSNPKVDVKLNNNKEINDLLLVFIPSLLDFNMEEAHPDKPLDFAIILNKQMEFIKSMENVKGSVIQYINFHKSVIQQIDNSKKNIDKLKNESKEKENSRISFVNIPLINEEKKLKDLQKSLNENQEEITKLENQLQTLNPEISLSHFFEQYLVDKKKEQAYALADEETEKAEIGKQWFLLLEQTFQTLFEEEDLKLKHKFNNTNITGKSSFYFEFPDGRTAVFNELADGYKSILNMFSEILLQMEAFKFSNKIEEEPSGIVLIDEIEAHLHISLQEKILPVLTQFFPTLQFIVCSHSPQVIASIENCNIYDLTTKELVTDFLGGLSYDVISKVHFGIETEYSLMVSKWVKKAKNILKKTEKSPEDEVELKRIEGILSEISPELTHEIFLYFNMKQV